MSFWNEHRPAAHYSRTAVALHWLIAALIIAAIFMG
jgi:cytochrome b561